jgi:hypothetical protein
MLLYTAKIANHNVSVPPAFAQRGITDQTQSTLGVVDMFARYEQAIPAYQMYKSNIGLFVAATSLQINIPTITTFKGLDYTRPVIPLKWPTVVLEMTKSVKVTDGVKTLLETNMHEYGVSVDKFGRDRFKMTINNYNPIIKEKCEALWTDGGVAGPKELNFKFLGTYDHLIHVLSEFLALQSYPAFETEAGDDDEMDLEKKDEEHGWKRPTLTVKSTLVDALVTAREEKAEREGVDEDDIEEISMILAEASMGDVVSVARPSLQPATINYGPPSAVPFLPGIGFPFFKGLIIPDRTTIAKIYKEHFLSTSGDTWQELEAFVKQMRFDLDNGSNTDLHSTLSHIFFVLDMAIHSQTRLFVTIADNGDYLGCVLLGCRFKVYTGLKWVDSSSADNLQADLRLLATHTGAVSWLHEFAVASRSESTSYAEHTLEECERSSMMLLEMLVATDTEKYTNETRVEVGLWLSRLQYGRAYRGVNAASVEWGLTQIREKVLGVRVTPEHFEEYKDEHVYLPPSLRDCLSLTSTFSSFILALFGSHSFSFQSAKGMRSNLRPARSETLSVDKDGRTYAKSLYPDVLYIFRKPLQTCINEMTDLADTRKDSSISFGQKKERAIASRSADWVDDERMIDILNLLQYCHYPKRSEVVAKVTRKAEAEEGEGRAAKRTEVDILNMFKS